MRLYKKRNQFCYVGPNLFLLIINFYRFSADKGKGEAIPLQALTGPEGPRRLRLPDFKTIGI
jgi:hypothetical protein